MKSISSQYVTFEFESESNIVKASYNPGVIINLDAAKSIVDNRIEVTGGKPHYFFIDFSNIRQVTAEAKKYMQAQDYGLKNILAAAFVADNPIARLIAQIYVKTQKKFDARFFESKEDALMWLKALSSKNNT